MDAQSGKRLSDSSASVRGWCGLCLWNDHAQQAAEKYLKAFLVWHQIEFSKTHDIETLLKLAETGDAGILEMLAEATGLTPYGVEYRYPGDYPEATLEDAKHATDLAMLVRSEVLRRLPADIVPEGG